MKIIPTLISMYHQNHERAVISFEVYQQHPDRYYRNCYDSVNQVPPVIIEDWNTIGYVDFKLFFTSWRNRDYRVELRRDLDRFLMNSHPYKVLHVSLDDAHAALSRQLLAQHFDRLKWQGQLSLQICDRTATRDAAAAGRMAAKFFKGQQFNVIEYHKQLLLGPENSFAVMYDLSADNPIPQHYLHDPPQRPR
jgi:hypothetical protein